MTRIRLAWLLLWRRTTGLEWLGVAAALTAATVLSIGFCATAMVRDSVDLALNGLGATDRLVVINYDDLASGSAFSAAEQVASVELAHLTSGPVSNMVSYRPVSDGAHSRVQLIAVSDLAATITLTGGRLPASCTPTRCEVVVIGDENPQTSAVGTTEVGRGSLRADSALSLVASPDAVTLIALGVQSAATLPQLEGFPAVTSWFAPLQAPDIHRTGLTKFLANITASRDALSAVSSHLTLSAPDGVLATAAQRAEIGGRRVAGQALSLLVLLFVITTLFYLLARERLIETTSALRTFGKRVPLRLQTSLVSFTSIAVASAIAVIAGHRRFAAYLPTALHTMPIDTWAAPIAMVSLPVTVMVARAALRVLRAPFARAVSSTHSRTLALFASLVAVTISLGTISAVQLATLEQGDRDSTIYRVPLASVVAPLAQQPLAVHPLEWYAQASGGQALGVYRMSATIRTDAITAKPLQLLGLDHEVWAHLPNLTRQAGDVQRAAQLLPESQPAASARVGTSGVVNWRGSGAVLNVHVLLWTLDTEGQSHSVVLATGSSSGSVQVPAGSTLQGIQVVEDGNALARRQHALSEGKGIVRAPHGRIQISLDTQNHGQYSSNLTGDYALDTGPVYIPSTTAPASLPVIADEQTARDMQGRQLVVSLPGDKVLVANIVAALHNFPTASERFLIADASALASAVSTLDPSLVRVTDVWTTGTLPHVPGVLVTTREWLDHQARIAPVRVWSARAVALLILTALCLALIATWTVVRHLVRKTDCLAWEAVGLDARGQRRALSEVVLTAVAASSVVAVVVSAALTRVTVSRMAYGLQGDIAHPALVASVPIAMLAVGVVATNMCAALVAKAGTHSMDSGDYAFQGQS